MKKIKLLVLMLTISATVFYSCSDSKPIENEAETSKSISLRTTLNEIKKANNISGKTNQEVQDQFFCFNFVYPLTLSYNNGTVVTVATFEGLLEVLANENSALYIDGIAYPFQVQEETTITTINNEGEFFALIQDCSNFQTVNECVFDFTCYELVYPFSIINQNQQTVEIDDQAELMQYASSPAGTTGTYQLNIVFPISVIQNNQTIAINDLYEFYNLNNDCAGSDCICTAEYAPVCVQTSTGVVEYSNACHAECAGFTSADFVNCSGNNPSSFGQLLGSCFTFAYPVQVEYQGALVTVHNDGELLQYWFPSQGAYPAIHYPATVTFITPNVSATVANQASLEFVIGEHCN